MKFTFLGTGPAKSVKGKGKNRRRNSSALIRDKVNILIDVTPEFEEQMKTFAPNLNRIDYLLLTHGHSDCIGGWYQLRKWLKKHNQEKITVICERKTLYRIKDNFKDASFARFVFVKPGSLIKIKDLVIRPFRVIHAEAFPTGKKFPCLGYRINNLVYAEDMENIPKESKKYFKNASVMIIDAAMWFGKQLRGHMNAEQSLKFAKQFNPKYLVLTQAGHTYPSYSKAQKIIQNYAKKLKIKSKVKLSYDGMKINVSKRFRRLQIMSKVPGEEGGTRSEAAVKFWKENWWKMFPKSGHGVFIYHHHYRGLTKEESKMSEEELLRTDNSVHGDLRCQATKDYLWGFTVFTGSTEDLRKANGCRLCQLKGNEKMQGTFKLAEPIGWAYVARKHPVVTGPGDIGATKNYYAKFFAEDWGEYDIGVWREHAFEIFLHGKKLKGRYIIQFAPVGGRRIWLISHPEDQRPYAETHKKAEVINELRRKKQKWLIWARPGCKPILYDVNKVTFPIRERMSKNFQFAIASHQLGNVKFLDLRLEKDDYCEIFSFMPVRAAEKNVIRIGSRLKKKTKAPLELLNFEGIIPKGKPGAARNYPGIFRILDRGYYEILEEKSGYQKIYFKGKKLIGTYIIRRIQDEDISSKTQFRYVFDKPEVKNDTVVAELLTQLHLLLSSKIRTEESILQTNLKLHEQLGDKTPLIIAGVALKEGTWNGIFYPAFEIQKAAEGLKGHLLMADHSKSVRDVVGKVTKSWYDPSIKGIRFEAEVIDEDIAKRIKEGLINGVSVGVVVDRIRENARLVARNFEFKELSLVLIPACPDARIEKIKNQ